MEDLDTSYARHLAEVNKHNQVVVSEDIYNEQGALVIASGTVLAESKVEVIAKHKLVKPLEQSVDVADSLDDKTLLAYLNKFSSSVPGLHALIAQDDVQKILAFCCQQYNKYPLLRQKLTVMARQMTHRYYHALFSASAGVIIAKEMQLPEEDAVTIFLAGLMHDVGMLHIPPEVCNKKGRYTPEERRVMEAHPVIGKHFLDMVPNLPSAVSRAVLEHHETALGTGYPKRKCADQLAVAGQVIALCDLMIAYYTRYKAVEGLSKELTVTAMRLNQGLHFEKVNQAAVSALSRVNNPIPALKELPPVQELIESQERLKSQFDKITLLVSKLVDHIDERIKNSIMSMYDQLSVTMIRAGIFQTEFTEWLQEEGEKEGECDGLELLKLQVMHHEVDFQFNRLLHLIWEGIEAMPTAKQKIKLVAESYYKKMIPKACRTPQNLVA
ncbi:hypothetical protein R50073_18280 [Maricurvus nonylphenolicus]|uniref:HD-GYP domain-containing protein n=1 Tax=Maricurvus nonylphenolicus TaxID=1008307 RepID=UPI0036F1B2B7